MANCECVVCSPQLWPAYLCQCGWCPFCRWHRENPVPLRVVAHDD